MSKSVVPHLQQQEKVNTYFEEQASFWKNIYGSGSVQGQIYRDRQAAALEWIDSFALASGARVLEIGCGAGLLTVTLAQRGLHVHAIDSSEAMVELARRYAEETATVSWVSLSTGDVYALAFEDDSFDLVVALGVIPWLALPELAMQEMARVTKPTGHVVLTSSNRTGLINLLDPWKNPALRPLKRSTKALIERVGLHRWSPEAPMAALRSRRFIDKALAKTGLIKDRGRTIGFGPFTLRRRRIFSESTDGALHRHMQSLANRNIPAFRSLGMSYLVQARKTLVRLPAEAPGSEKTVHAARQAL